MAYGCNHLHLISLLSTLLYCWQCPGWWPRCEGSSPPSPGSGRWSWLPCSPDPAAGPAPTRACCQPYDDDDDDNDGDDDDDDDDPPDHGVDGVQVPGLRVLDNLGEEGATHPLPRSRGCSAVISVPSYLLCLLRLPSKRMNSSLLSVSSQHTAPAWYAGALYHV